MSLYSLVIPVTGPLEDLLHDSVKHTELAIVSVNMSEPNLKVIKPARSVKDSDVLNRGLRHISMKNAELLFYTCFHHVELIEYLDKMKLLLFLFISCSRWNQALSGQRIPKTNYLNFNPVCRCLNLNDCFSESQITYRNIQLITELNAVNLHHLLVLYFCKQSSLYF